jgi:hypothetical protein
MPPISSELPFAAWQRQEILLLIAAVQLTLLTAIGWLIARRVARHTRFQQKLAQAQVELTRAAATYRARKEDPHTTVRRLVTNVTRQPIGELTPLRGSVAPIYLLFREDDTRRRLLLAADGDLKAALHAERVRQSALPCGVPLPRRWRRFPVYAITPFNSGALALEEIEDAWAALAPRLNLLSVIPSAGRWELVMLPPEELA